MKFLLNLFKIDNKQCFTCRLYLPLFLFDKCNVPHILKIAANKGRNFGCKICIKQEKHLKIYYKNKR